MSKLLRSLALVACCLFFSGTAYADRVSVEFGSNTSAFSLTVTGSAITRNLTYGMTLDVEWLVIFTITERVVGGADVLMVSATARHITAPHGEPASGFTFLFMPPALNSRNNFPMSRSATEGQLHVNHTDTYLARVELFGFNGQSTRYTFHLEGQHCPSVLTCPELPEEVEIPEPATLLLLGTGVGAVALRLRRRFRGEKSGPCSRDPFS